MNTFPCRAARVGSTQSNISTPRATIASICGGVPTPITYRAFSRGRLEIEFTDPGDDPVTEQRLRALGIPKVQLEVLEQVRKPRLVACDTMNFWISSKPEALKKVTMVGNDFALDPGIGSCGKDGQTVPVGVGMPTVRMDGITVGGTHVE